MEIKELKIHKPSLAKKKKKMKVDRQPYLDKAREAAKYTIPSLITDDTNSRPQTIETPHQSVGADGVNNLAAKTTLALLPPNQPFYKFSMDEMAIKQQAQLTGQDKAKYEQDITKGLSTVEKMLTDYNEQHGDRVCFGEAQKHYYVAGNVMLIHTPKDGLKYYPLNRYVVKRDYVGNILIAITLETMNFFALPYEMQETVLNQIAMKEKKNPEDVTKELKEKDIDLFTCYKRKGKHWETWQEVEGVEVPKSRGKYPIDVCPCMPLRYAAINGESYGRGLIEEYIGDISYLDTLSLAIKETSLAAAKLLIMVSPNGVTKIKTLAKSKNGDFVVGRPEDVKALQTEKYYDLRTAQAEEDKIERRLNRIFLLKAAIQRDAERVTAEEIREMAKDLDEAHGNLYSTMSKEFQYNYVKISFYHMRKEKGNELPDLIKDKAIKLTVTTGLEALGRGSELTKLATFFDIMAKFAQAAQVVGAKTEPIAAKVAASLNLDIEGLFYTEEEKAEMQKQAQQAELMKVAAPNAVNKYGDMMMKQQEQEGQLQ